MENAINWSAYMEHWKSVLRKFDNIAAFTNDLPRWYFWIDPKPSIYTSLDKHNHDLNDSQVVVEWTVNAKAKTA